MKPTMLYRAGSSIEWEGLSLDFVVVDAEIDGEIERHLERGWFEHPCDTQETACDVAINTETAPRRRGRPPKAKA